jgi:hypothetical protein
MKFLTSMTVVAAALSMTSVAQATTFYQDNFDTVSPGFTTTYTYVAATPGALYPEGLYTIGNNPNAVHSLWSSFTNGTGNALIVNGATNGVPSLVFGENGSITAPYNGLYKFTADVANICCNANFSPNTDEPSDLNFYFTVNGTQSLIPAANFTSVLGTNGTYPGAGTFIPVTAEVLLNAGDTFSFQIMNGSGAQSGNDFALDNISFSSVTSGVPELSTWAMMLLGFAGIGFTGYRQTKKSPAAFAAM